MDADTARERREAGSVRLLDVRSPAEYEGLHIPGSYNVPLDRVDRYADELTGVEEELLLVCRTGNRAEEARKKLAGAGVAGARVLEGGLTAWRDRDLPVNEGRSRWRIERQVRFAAGLLVLTGAVLGALIHTGFYGLSAFVGAGLLFAAVTDTCAMGLVLARMPFNRTAEEGPTAAEEVERLLGEAAGRESAPAFTH